MDLIQLETEDASKSPVKYAKLLWVGQNNSHFGTKDIGEELGRVVQVHHVLPYTNKFISHPDHVHAIIKYEWAEKTSFELDVKLEFIGG